MKRNNSALDFVMWGSQSWLPPPFRRRTECGWPAVPARTASDGGGSGVHADRPAASRGEPRVPAGTASIARDESSAHTRTVSAAHGESHAQTRTAAAARDESRANTRTVPAAHGQSRAHTRTAAAARDESRANTRTASVSRDELRAHVPFYAATTPGVSLGALPHKSGAQQQ